MTKHLIHDIHSLSLSQEHLQACQFESLQCSNAGCSETMQRKDLQEHLRISCSYRMEPCHYCKHPYTCCQLEVNARGIDCFNMFLLLQWSGFTFYDMRTFDLLLSPVVYLGLSKMVERSSGST